jgi:hypothetical protein
VDGEASRIRIAHNQSTFRDANERIELSAEKMKLYGSLVPFICECPREGCSELMRMTLDEYEAVRADSTLFATVVGHQDLSVESGAARVVEEHEEYVVVRKIGVAGEIAKDRAGDLPELDESERQEL